MEHPELICVECQKRPQHYTGYGLCKLCYQKHYWKRKRKEAKEENTSNSWAYYEPVKRSKSWAKKNYRKKGIVKESEGDTFYTGIFGKTPRQAIELIIGKAI